MKPKPGDLIKVVGECNEHDWDEDEDAILERDGYLWIITSRGEVDDDLWDAKSIATAFEYQWYSGEFEVYSGTE